VRCGTRVVTGRRGVNGRKTGLRGKVNWRRRAVIRVKAYGCQSAGNMFGEEEKVGSSDD